MKNVDGVFQNKNSKTYVRNPFAKQNDAVYRLDRNLFCVNLVLSISNTSKMNRESCKGQEEMAWCNSVGWALGIPSEPCYNWGHEKNKLGDAQSIGGE